MTDPIRPRLRGVVLLVGALVVGLVIQPVGSAHLYWMPLIIGVTTWSPPRSAAAPAACGSPG